MSRDAAAYLFLMVRGQHHAGESPDRYLRVVLIGGILLTLIIFTGAAVRLTESGLGCEDWPTCDGEKIVPELNFHGWVEFGNRLLSGVVAIGTIAAVLWARRREPRRPDLIRWAWYLVAGVVAQVIVGGITVLVDLHPLLVSTHFLLSILLLWMVVVLWFKATGGIGRPEPLVDAPTVRHSLGLIAVATALLVTGTVVTGSGPNSGDFRADRFNLDLTWAARIHAVMAWVTLAVMVTLALRLVRAGRPVSTVSPAIIAAVAQGGVGYLQYGIGVPPGLVMVHIVGAVAVWLLVLRQHFLLFERPIEVGVPPRRRSSDRTTYEANFLGG